MNLLSNLWKLLFLALIAVGMFWIIEIAVLHDKQQQDKFNDEIVDLIKSNKPWDEFIPDAENKCSLSTMTPPATCTEPYLAKRFDNTTITATGFVFGYIPVRQQVSINQGFEQIQIQTWRTDMRSGAESSITPVEACQKLLDSKGPPKRRR